MNTALALMLVGCSDEETSFDDLTSGMWSTRMSAANRCSLIWPL